MLALIATVFRVLLGLLVAALAAGLVLVAFVVTPADLAALSGEALTERLVSAGLLALAVATHSAIFAAPFALLAIVVGEWLGLRRLAYYALIGGAIGVAGFLAQHASEAATAEATVLNTYAAAAYVTAGLVAGIVYWAMSGRYGHRRQRPSTPAVEAGTPASGSTEAAGA